MVSFSAVLPVFNVGMEKKKRYSDSNSAPNKKEEVADGAVEKRDEELGELRGEGRCFRY
jgi:hypothetical protein